METFNTMVLGSITPSFVFYSQLFFFVMFTIQRGISGLQNSFGYKYSNLKTKSKETETNKVAQNKLKFMWITTIGLMFISLVVGALLSVGEERYVTSGLINAVSLIATFASLFSSFALANCFYPVIKSKLLGTDIHKWEVVITGSLMIVGILSGVNFFYLFVSVLLGMVFHKGFINRAFDLPFLHKQEITNDLTGNTYNIPSLGLTIKRFIKNGKLRLALAVVGLFLVLLNEFYLHIQFDIRTIAGWFN